MRERQAFDPGLLRQRAQILGADVVVADVAHNGGHRCVAARAFWRRCIMLLARKVFRLMMFLLRELCTTGCFITRNTIMSSIFNLGENKR
jgi:hypothetical protein